MDEGAASSRQQVFVPLPVRRWAILLLYLELTGLVLLRPKSANVSLNQDEHEHEVKKAKDNSHKERNKR
jgi:hypothetical protein